MECSYLYHHGVKGMKWEVRKDRRYTDKEISEYRKRKIAEAPTKSESPRGANKGWYKNAPKSVLIREMRREESEASKMNKKVNTRKDAKKYVLAKMYYGEGAGNRRKLINGRVNQRSKDLTYKKAFDEYVSKQNTNKAVNKAIRKRRHTDMAKAALPYASVAAAAAFSYAQKTGLTRKVARYGKTTIKDAAAYVHKKKSDALFAAYMRANDIHWA